MKKAEQPDDLLGLHERLSHGDRTASEEIAAHLLSRLVEEVSRRFPATDRHIVCDGVTDAILDYCVRPAQFDSRRGVPLRRFLEMASWRNVANLIRSEKRRKAREERAASDPAAPVVELDPAAGKLEQEEARRHRNQRAEMLGVLKDPADRRLLELRLSGERRTEAFAKVLGVSGFPLDVQRRAVKQAKDRIDKVLRRRKGTNS